MGSWLYNFAGLKMFLRDFHPMKMFKWSKVFVLLLPIASITMLLSFWAQCDPNNGASGKQENFLDGCHHVYLDMGTNTGVQIRKLYEPHLFPNASVLPIFDKFFGQEGERDLTTICTVGFEPNIIHNEVLHRLEEQYKACGWRVYINLGTGVGKEKKHNLDFAHKKVILDTPTPGSWLVQHTNRFLLC